MNRTVRTLVGSGIGIGIVVATTAGCSTGADSAGQQAVNGGTLTMAVPFDPGSLDPQHSAENVGVSRLAYDTPVTIDGKGNLVPGVVSEWLNIGTTSAWLLTVKPGVTCSDGSPMDAKTVADNINYVADPKNASPFTGTAVPAGAKAVPDQATGTLTVTTPSPSPFFVQSLQLLSLVCQKGLADRKLLASASYGSGPYVVSQSVPGDHVTYTLRKGYDWGPKGNTTTSVDGIPATVTVKTVTSTTTTANLLLNGQLNAAQVPGTDANRLKAARLYSAGGSQMGDNLLFNHAAGNPTADVAVRRALVGALDMGQIGSVDGGGLGGKATGLLAPPLICAGNNLAGNLPGFDLAGAKSQLDQAGWTAGSGGGTRSKGGKKLAVTLLYGSNMPPTKAAAEFIAAQWGKLGVDVSLVAKPSDQLVSGLFGGTAVFGAVLQPIQVATPAQLTPLLSGPAAPKGGNAADIRNAQYDALSSQAAKKPGTSGCDDWNAAEAALFKDADIAPLATVPNTWWGKNASFDVDKDGVILPTSVRLLAH